MSRVLIGCEESGKVRDAFRRRGIEAWSCDLLPTRGEYTQYHIQCDIMEILYDGWDALIAFPECTYLANSGAKHLYNDMCKSGGINRERLSNMIQAALFFKTLLEEKYFDLACKRISDFYAEPKQLDIEGIA